MKKTLHILQQIENVVLVVSFVIMVVAIFAQVVNRNIFKIPISGFEEAAKYSMVCMVLLGTELGLRDGTQIAVTSVVDKLHGKAKMLVQIIAKLIVIVFSGIMANASLKMVSKQMTVGQTSPGLGIPMYVPYSFLLFSFALITIVQLFMLISIIQESKREEIK